MAASVAHTIVDSNETGYPRWRWLLAGTAIAGLGIKRSGVSGAILCGVAGALVSQSFSPGRNSRLSSFARGTRLRTSIFVNAPPESCYTRWRNLEDLPQFLDYLDRVDVLSENRSVWVTRSVAGQNLRWEAEIIRDVPGEIIGWRSMPGSELNTSGSVRFTETSGGTLVTITMKYGTESALLEKALLALLDNDPEQQMEAMLWRFKVAVERSTVRPGQSYADPVDEAINESFPASDPPSWNPG